ncbi:MAG: ABC transporter substrate-binding protein [Lachnospiraceae bacterium]|nr:ABC transporter substrate-binding protein [Lachnospiraceae bacterium]
MKTFRFVKPAALLVALVLVIGVLAGCGGGSNQGSNAESGSAGGTEDSDVSVMDSSRIGSSDYVREQLTMAVGPATSLTPWGTSNKTPGAVEVYETLYGQTYEGVDFPILADATRGGNNEMEIPGCDHVEGKNEYLIYIWDNIYDHAGNHVTADDVVFSYTHQWKEELTSGWASLTAVEKVDDTTIRFEFSKEFGVGDFEQFFTMCYIVSEKTYNNSKSHLLDEMVGTGPYAMLSYTPGSQVTLVSYPNYWQQNEEYRPASQRQNVKKIVYKFISETATTIMSLKTGEVDLGTNISRSYTADFEDNGEYASKYDTTVSGSTSVASLWLNCSEESVCNDINMRLAIYYALDLDGIVALLGGYDEPAKVWACITNPDYYEEWEEMENYNTYRGSQQERRELVEGYLKAAGYDGSPLVYIYQSDQSDIASVVISMLTSYGIEVDSRGTDHAGSLAIEADPTAWDIEGGNWGGVWNVHAWMHAYDWANTATGDHTVNYIYDKEWQEQLELCLTYEGHTKENMTKYLEMLYDNAYGINLYIQLPISIYPNDIVYMYTTKSLVVPGACEYKEP